MAAGTNSGGIAGWRITALQRSHCCILIEGSSRVMTPTRGSGQEVFEISRVGLGRVRPIRSGGFQIIMERARFPYPTRSARFDVSREQPCV